MTVTTTSSTAGPYSPNGVTTAFPFPIAAYSAGELRVVRRSASGIDTPLGGYTVALTYPGGTVTFAVAPAAGDPIYILSNPSFLQQIDVANQGDFSPDVINEGFDRGVIRDLVLRDSITDVESDLAVEVVARQATDLNLANEIVGRQATDQAIIAGMSANPPTNVSLNAATRTILAALDSTLGLPAILTEGGRYGIFTFLTAANYNALTGRTLTADVTSDTLQIALVPKSTDATGASGAWVRFDFITTNRINVRWAGAVLDNATNDGAAVVACAALSYAMRKVTSGITAPGYGAGGGPSVYVPGIAYMASAGLTANHSFKLFGDNSGLASAIVCGLRWATGTIGITVNNPSLLVEGLALIGTFNGTEGEYHAFKGLYRPHLTNVNIANWQGDAINLDCTTGGNVNGAIIQNVRIQGCRNGYWNKAGSDNSGGYVMGLDIESCREFGVKEDTFLAVGHYSHEVANCGLTIWNDGINIGCSVTSYSGNRYFAISGQETWCSTHAPSGDTTDNQGWAYSGAGGANTAIGIIAWFSGILVRAGGWGRAQNSNAPSTFNACYYETGQGKAQISGLAVVYGGNLAQAVWKGTFAAPGSPSLFAVPEGLQTGRGIYADRFYFGTDETLKAQFAPPTNAGGLKCMTKLVASVNAPGGYTFGNLIGNDMVPFIYSNNGIYPITLTGPNTTEQLGTGSPQSGYMLLTRTALPDGAGINHKRVYRASTSSATYAAPSGGTTVDTQGRASLGQLAADLASLKAALQSAGHMT